MEIKKGNILGRWLIAFAGLLSLAYTFVHIFAGGADVHLPILASDLSEILKGYVSVVWHAVTATMLVCSALLFLAAWQPTQRLMLTSIVVVQYSAFAALFLVYGVVRFQSILVMPPWGGFLVILFFALMGLWVDHRLDTRMKRA